MAHTGSLTAIVVAGLSAAAWWAWPMGSRSPEEPTPVPWTSRSVPSTPGPIEAPPAALIQEAPTRPDGLDRVDACIGVAPGASNLYGDWPSLHRYMRRRRDELDAAMRAEASTILGARLRTALGVVDPVAPDAGDRAAETDMRFATATALAQGAARALQYDTMLRYARQAIELAPDDALGYVLASVAGNGLHDERLALAALRLAFGVAPHDRDIAFSILGRLGLTSDVMGRIAAADSFLDVDPDPSIAVIRARDALRAHVFANGVRRSEGPITVVGDPTLVQPEIDRVIAIVAPVQRRFEDLMGRPVRGEIVVWIYPDDASIALVTCGRRHARHAGVLAFTRAELGTVDGAELLRTGAYRQVAARATPLAPGWIQEGIAQYARTSESDADRAAYASLVATRHWFSVREMWRALGSDDREEVTRARAQTRALVEWLVSHRGEAVLGEIGEDGAGLLMDPIAELSRLAQAPLDEPRFLAFLSDRIAAASHPE